MTKIKNYTIKTPVIAEDKWIGTSGEDGITTKNFSAQGIADFVVSGLSPVDGGNLKITEIDISTLDTDAATTVNAMTPAYTVAQYEIVFFNIEDQVYILKVVDDTIGVGGTTLTNDDFITLPSTSGATGNGIQSIDLIGSEGLIDTYRITYTDSTTFDYNVTNGANGNDGNDGANGLNAVMTRSSTTSLTIASGGLITANFTSTQNLGWAIGMRLRVFNSTGNYMEGIVATPPTSTSVEIGLDYAVGSGTYSSWVIGVAGDVGASGSPEAIITENTTTSLTITSQALANLDYDLKIQKDGNKVFITGPVTNNTNSIVSGGQEIFNFIDSSYSASNTYFNATLNTISTHENGFLQINGLSFKTISDIPEDASIWLDLFYFTN